MFLEMDGDLSAKSSMKHRENESSNWTLGTRFAFKIPGQAYGTSFFAVFILPPLSGPLNRRGQSQKLPSPERTRLKPASEWQNWFYSFYQKQ